MDEAFLYHPFLLWKTDYHLDLESEVIHYEAIAHQFMSLARSAPLVRLYLEKCIALEFHHQSEKKV